MDLVKIIIATIKPWNIRNVKNFCIRYKDKYEVKTISSEDELKFSSIFEFNPRFIFFPHWSWKIPEKIFQNFECIIFHMTDLPYGRGGSPLQNLILRDFQETKISAIKCEHELDAGPIYCKESLSLIGTAGEIFIKCSDIIFDLMIPYIIENQPIPKDQLGKPTYFKRRIKEQGNIANLKTIKEIYNYIRMLDAVGYPLAFLENDGFIFEFKSASLKSDHIVANVIIKEKKGEKN